MRPARWIAAAAACAALALAAPAPAPAQAIDPDAVRLICTYECLAVCFMTYPEFSLPCVDPEPTVTKLKYAVDRYVAEVEDTIDETTHVTSTVGAGSAAGTVSFAAPGVPKTGDPCAPTSFSLSGSSEAFAINTVITGYAGPITLTGSGSSSCESTSAASGLLALTASGTGPTGSTVQCTNLTGGYTRVATDVVAQLGGTCVVNNYAAPVSFVFRGEFAPTGVGAGVTTSIRTASFDGAFLVAPA